MDPALFSLALSLVRTPSLPPHGLMERPVPVSSCTQRHLPEPFLARFFRSEIPKFRDKKAGTRCLDRLAEWSILEPFRERPAGPKHTRAEQDQS